MSKFSQGFVISCNAVTVKFPSQWDSLLCLPKSLSNTLKRRMEFLLMRAVLKNHFHSSFLSLVSFSFLIQFLHVFKFCDSEPMAFVQLALVCAHSARENRWMKCFREAEIILEIAFLAQTRHKGDFLAQGGNNWQPWDRLSLGDTENNVLTNSELTFCAIAQRV